MSRKSSFKWMALRRLPWAHERFTWNPFIHFDLRVWDYWTLLSVKKCERFTFTLLHLIHGAPARGFVGTPAKKSRAVSKASAGEMVVSNFNDYFRSDWFPFAGAVSAPAAWSSGRIPSESRCFL